MTTPHRGAKATSGISQETAREMMSQLRRLSSCLHMEEAKGHTFLNMTDKAWEGATRALVTAEKELGLDKEKS